MSKLEQDRSAERKSAVALKYEHGVDPAPRVVASGKGLIAEKIVELAQAAEIPVEERPELARALGKIQVGQEIPVELYKTVAELLAFVHRLQGKVLK